MLAKKEFISAKFSKSLSADISVNYKSFMKRMVGFVYCSQYEVIDITRGSDFHSVSSINAILSRIFASTSYKCICNFCND